MNAILLAMAAGVCWGVGEVCTRSALHGGHIGPMTAIALRSTVALPLLWLAWTATSGGVALLPAEPSLRRADGATLAKVILGSGIVAGALAMIFFYAALALGEVSRIKPIAFGLAPATGVLLGWLVLGESMNLRKVVAVGLIILGVVLLSSSGRVATTA